MTKLSAQEQLAAIHIWIARHPEFSVLSPLTQVGESKMRDDIPTACTDGWNKYYGTAFFASLTKEERRFVVLHELSHQSRMHITLMKDLHKINHMAANMAMDFAINGDLIRMDDGKNEIKMPDMGCHDPKYYGWDVRRIFRDLMQQAKDQGGQGQGQGQGGGGFDAHDFDKEPTVGGSGNKPSPQEMADRVAQALQQGKVLSDKIKKIQGVGAGNRNGVVDSLLAPQINWKDELSEFVQTFCAGTDESTWRKPSRRYLSDDIYMPSLYSEKVEKLVIGFDTSGSCFGGAEMQAFASEMASIIERLQPAKTVVAYVDWEVQGSQVFEDGQFAVQDMQIKGGGGTDLEKLWAWMTENKHDDAQAVVYFTDGYSSFLTPPKMPVLWCMSTEVRAPYGKNIQINV